MIDENALGKAFGVTAAIFWIVCSTLFWMSPGMMMNMSGYMANYNTEMPAGNMHFTGFLTGFVVWIVLWALAGWMVATFYNRFNTTEE
jgi:hypothetical protein